MAASTPLATYRRNKALGYSPQASAVSAIMLHADTTTESRDRVNVVRKVCPPSRKNFGIKGCRND